ncbi:MAG: membrane dipeptidase [Bacteroidales bacterium]|nr:membrane dipeptidase [Bacteroidales bacterium]
MNYIDFHSHPSFKTYLSADNEQNRENCWEDVDVTGIFELIDKLVGDILDSQCSLSQMDKGKVQIAVVGLYALEKAMAKGSFLKNINISLIDIAKVLDELDQTLLSKIASGQYGYNDIYKQVREHLLLSRDISFGFKPISSISEIDRDKLNIIFSLEGGHALFNDVNNYTDDEVISNLEEIKSFSHRTLHLTLTHLSKCPLGTHAFGMKFIIDEDFYPEGFGISELGFKVIKKALKNGNNEKRILIDVKHMSLQSRLQYYKLLKEPEYSNVPIIASHCATTGVSMEKMPIKKIDNEDDKYVTVEYDDPKGLMDTEFNPWSINLYDEEIPVIINSNGIIGIILDERVLGFRVDEEKSHEIFSKEEFEKYRETVTSNFNKYINLDIIKKEEDEKIDVDDLKLIFNKRLRHLCNNILHIVKVGGEKAWKHICIGSDFDGMVDAVNCCKNSEKFKKLERKLCKMLPKMAKTDPDTNYYINNVKDRVKSLMYGNAKRFLEENFN